MFASSILTLNTHSYMEQIGVDEQLSRLSSFILSNHITRIALQEVNQHKESNIIDPSSYESLHFLPCSTRIPLRSDNFSLRLCQILQRHDPEWYFGWTVAHYGYPGLEEGIAMVVYGKPSACYSIELTPPQLASVTLWKTRVATACEFDHEIFVSTHMGWWNDDEASFKDQWTLLTGQLHQDKSIWIMGDLNNDSAVRNEGYDLTLSAGWYDTWQFAVNHDDGATVCDAIDGWRDQAISRKRLDYILCNKKIVPSESKVVFRGDEAISDHAGVMVTL